MYLINNYYLEALEKEDLRSKARIRVNGITIDNSDISSIKYDLSLSESEKFTIGGVHGANVTLNLLNYEGKFDNYKFDNKEFCIDLKIDIDELYKVGQFNSELVKIIDALKIKHITSLWIPQGVFYPTSVKKDENKKIIIELIDKSKYLEDDYVCSLQPPFTLKDLYTDVHDKAQIATDTSTFYNQDILVNTVPERIYI